MFQSSDYAKDDIKLKRDVDLDATLNENEVLPTEQMQDWHQEKLHPTRVAEKDWQDSYKLSRLIRR